MITTSITHIPTLLRLRIEGHEFKMEKIKTRNRFNTNELSLLSRFTSLPTHAVVIHATSHMLTALDREQRQT